MAKTALFRGREARDRPEGRDEIENLAKIEAQAIANAYYINKFQQMESSLDQEYEEGFRSWLMGQSAFHGPQRAEGASACNVDGANLTMLPGVRDFCKSKEDQITEFLKRKKRLETLGPMNLEDAYYYYKYIINGEEFKPTSIYAREPEDPRRKDYSDRNTQQPFTQAEPPGENDEGPGPDESRQPDKRASARRIEANLAKLVKIIREQKEQAARIHTDDNEAVREDAAEALGNLPKKAAKEALIQSALPGKKNRGGGGGDEGGEGGDGGGAPPPGDGAEDAEGDVEMGEPPTGSGVEETPNRPLRPRNLEDQLRGEPAAGPSGVAAEPEAPPPSAPEAIQAAVGAAVQTAVEAAVQAVTGEETTAEGARRMRRAVRPEDTRNLLKTSGKREPAEFRDEELTELKRSRAEWLNALVNGKPPPLEGLTLTDSTGYEYLDVDGLSRNFAGFLMARGLYPTRLSAADHRAAVPQLAKVYLQEVSRLFSGNPEITYSIGEQLVDIRDELNATAQWLFRSYRNQEKERKIYGGLFVRPAKPGIDGCAPRMNLQWKSYEASVQISDPSCQLG
eukprot:tig00021761_g23446.t1